MQRQIGVDDSDESDIWKMQPFRNHLGPDQDIDLACAKCAQRFAIRFLARHRIGIHSFHNRVRKNLRDERFYLFRSEADVDQRLLTALWTFSRNGGGMAAKMTIQPRHGSMKGERDTAIRTLTGLPALAAEQRSGKTAAIQKQNCLFAFGNPSRDSIAQFFRQN